MAKAFFNSLISKKSKWYAESAGTQPSESLNPIVVEAMNELSIDISAEKPRALNFNTLTGTDRLISMGCNIQESCPINLRNDIEDWELEDPKNQDIQKVREIRDIIKIKVENLIEELSITN